MTHEEDQEDDTTYRDAVGGEHGGGVGWNPNGVFCGECNRCSCQGCPAEGTL